jgi:hypothetical protein
LPLGVAHADGVADLIESIETGAASLDELMYPTGSSRRQGLYHAVGVTKQRPPAGKRGSARDVDAIPGAWADFDVREDSFRDWAHIFDVISAMDRLGIGPQIIVSTGSGGAHCYWRANGGMNPQEALMHSTRIRRWVQANYAVKVDNVAQENRIMRLPGSIRFPKSSKDLMRSPVLVGMPRNDAVFADFTALQVVTEDAWRAVEDRIGEQRSRVTWDWDRAVDISLQEFSLRDHEDLDADGFGVSAGEADEGWAGRYKRFSFEIAFNRDVTWSQILEPKGWVKFGEPDSQGRQSWTRPGAGPKNPRSAVTDWEQSPNVMSLLSDSESTGLSSLYTLADEATERRHKLTKVRVAAELWAGGSIERLIKTWLKDER